MKWWAFWALCVYVTLTGVWLRDWLIVGIATVLDLSLLAWAWRDER